MNFKYQLYSIMMMAILITSCKNENNSNIKKEEFHKMEKPIILDLNAANNLISLPLSCVLQEYPNKLGQVIGSRQDLREPSELHPAFYGCFDWHSAVHGHWSLIKLLKEHPNVEGRKDAVKKLKTTLTKENILTEVKYFDGKHNKSYERTYGWAWLLKLAEELHNWDDPLASELEENLQPLTNLVVKKYIEFLPKLVYPIRVGEHTNTAFGMSFAYDFAISTENVKLKSILEERAKDFYMNDIGCPLSWEPSGYDFLSPCLEEANLMSKVLPKEEFVIWMNGFLPQLADKTFLLSPGKVSDRTDGKLVHLDGLNFSRSWCLYRLAQIDKKYEHLVSIANRHIEHSLPSLVGDDYEGGHWLGSFAIYACDRH